MNRRANYPDHRKYQSWQLKRLIRQIECNLSDINNFTLSIDKHQEKIKECQEMFCEIALRLD